MNIREDFLWFKLYSAKGFGPKRMYSIYKYMHDYAVSLEQIFGMNWQEFHHSFPKLTKANFDALQVLNSEKVYAEYQNLLDKGIQIIYLGHEFYPVSLLKLLENSAPPLLFCKDNLSLLKSEGVSIVGSRNASNEGIEMAKQFAADLAVQSKNIISGYAKGIDTSAHVGALEKDGTTIIVLSSGILEFSEKKVFRDLRSEKNILVISQFYPSEKWSARNAMIRNKLICALSKAMVVIESGLEKNSEGKMSGAFDAGKNALKMEIPLFVVSPNAFQNPPNGNKELIKLGGVEIIPKDGIEIILKYLHSKITKDVAYIQQKLSFY